ncbi:tRNA (adenine-N(1)-)-methyltransferase catalytic subunit trm61 [Mortierella alpina]|uniref:tRNA (adenine(58)-N(1))-methyltransferase catalytic subunit TRM61 n=1 Tax=Mortierella alpina TaxID=64518 RepID=A0A9P6IY89_MORAP|nr:tRNA (adenine-N(1)-)-methyltransferase catalytic subunit trm61 [Mortierella alpina]
MIDSSIHKQSFGTYKANNTIENGDPVVLFLSKENMILIRIRDGDEYICKFGQYRHADMIGLQYGTKLGSNTGRGFVYLLHPTPELWTLILPHRTQILYIADISFVMNFLNLKPGMSMIESGTGSGSFSHSIARTIAPTGHLYTFEYHQERVNVATAEFEEHGLSDMVTIRCRDVCKDGFGLENKVDAVFLDLPAPWEAVGSAKRAFRQNKIGKICTFSPCIEQISKTVTALNEHGFVDIQMYECLIRFNELRVHTVTVVPIDEALEKEREFESKRKRALPRVLRESFKKSLEDARNSTEEEDQNTQDGDEGSRSKRPRTDASSRSDAISPAAEPRNILTTRLPAENRGHTSYLLFATFTPATQGSLSTQPNAAPKHT